MIITILIDIIKNNLINTIYIDMKILYYVLSEIDFSKIFGAENVQDNEVNNLNNLDVDIKFDKVVYLLLGREVIKNSDLNDEIKLEIENYYSAVPDDVKSLKNYFEENFEGKDTIIQFEEFNGKLTMKEVESFFKSIYDKEKKDAEKYFSASLKTVTHFLTFLSHAFHKYGIQNHPISENVIQKGLEEDPLFYKKMSEYASIAYEHVFGIKLSESFNKIITSDEKLIETKYIAGIAAKKDLSVWIFAESGTGKELFAKAIHESSARVSKNFIPLNCAAISKELLNSELFGHVKGAFTGATGDKKGIFEEANGGTVLLDEIADISLDTQALLLRTLDTGKIRKVGDPRETEIDVRIISASHKNLYEMVEKKRFREDLFYRLNKFELRIPPLRERSVMDKILLFAKVCSENNFPAKNITESASKIIFDYEFPGNVRQFFTIIERAIIYSEVFKKVIDDDIIIKSIGEMANARFNKKQILNESVEANGQLSMINILNQKFGHANFYEGFKLKDFLAEVEKYYIIEALKKYKVQKIASNALDYSQQVISNKIKKYKINTRMAS